MLQIDRTKKMHVEELSILEKINDENKIIIWPSLPYWLYINKESVELIKGIDGHSFIELLSLLAEKYNISPDENEIYSIIETLHNAKVLYFEGEDNQLKHEDFSSYVIQYITFNITDSCNLYCSHCYIDSSNQNKQFMSLETAKKIIDSIAPYMIEDCRVNISGGEALLNKDLFDILKYFESKNIGKLNLVTNGTLITKEVASKLKEIGNLRVQISLDGASPEVHEEIRGKNTYQKTMKGINNLIEQDVKVHLSPMVTKSFFDEIDDYFTLAKKLGIKAVFLQPVINVGRAKENGLERVNNAIVFKKVVEMYENDPSLIDLIPGTLEAMFMANIKLLNRFVNCGTGMGTLAIQPNGDCYPCPNTIIESMKCGNILENDFYNIWMDSAIFNTLREIRVDKSLDAKCGKCEVRHFCGGGCRGQALNNTGNLYGLSCTCEYDKEMLTEMLWLAAQKPHMFESEATRQLELGKVREEQTKAVNRKIRDSYYL